MARKTAFFFDESCFWHSAGQYALNMPVGGWVQPPAAGGLAESPESKRRMKNLMDVSGLTAQLDVRTASPAHERDLLRIHPQAYLDRFKAISDAGGGEFGDHAPVGPGSYEIAKLSAGLAMGAVEAVMSGEADNAYAMSRPPGHHCQPDQAMGFCFFANVALAVEAAQARFGVARVAVLDWDVHHGNGTQHIFYERDDVLTMSLHQEGCFPPGFSGENEHGAGAGEGYNINVPLPAGAGEAAYLQALERIAMPALERFQPQLIIVASGYDANALDPLARMQLSSEAFRRMTKRVCEAAEQLCDGRLVLIHEGGYSEAYVPFCGHATIEALAGVETAAEDPEVEFIGMQQPRGATAEFQRHRVEQLAALFDAPVAAAG